MKKLFLLVIIALFLQAAAFAQIDGTQIQGKEVAKNDDIVFHKIDAHTWVGTGKMMYNESVYLVEGNTKALLIDAGTKIADLDKIVASITDKPIMLVATHAHPDHTGSAINYFSELYIAPGDAKSPFVKDYTGTIKELKDGELIDLGGRTIEVVFTPGHTPGSTTFIDKNAGYGFSGDSFGSGNLLVFDTFTNLISTCKKTSAIMKKYNIKKLYPGHYYGVNAETKQRVDDLASMSKDVLAGKVKGEENPDGIGGLNKIYKAHGVNINYNDASMK